MAWRGAAASNVVCVPGERMMWTHLETSGRFTKDWKLGPTMGLQGITPKTLLQVLDSLSLFARGFDNMVNILHLTLL